MVPSYHPSPGTVPVPLLPFGSPRMEPQADFTCPSAGSLAHSSRLLSMVLHILCYRQGPDMAVAPSVLLALLTFPLQPPRCACDRPLLPLSCLAPLSCHGQFTSNLSIYYHWAFDQICLKTDRSVLSDCPCERGLYCKNINNFNTKASLENKSTKNMHSGGWSPP